MKTKELLTLFALMLISASSMAQENNSRFGFEFNADASMAVNKLGGTELNPGGGFEAIVHYQFMPHTGAYAGWGWNKFSANQSFAGSNSDFEETGYLFGIQFKHPFRGSSTSYFFRAGGLYNHIEIENNDGNIIEDTGHQLGLQLAAGVDIPLAGRWNLMPGLKFNSHSHTIDGDGKDRNLNLNYISARIGIVKTF